MKSVRKGIVERINAEAAAVDAEFIRSEERSMAVCCIALKRGMIRQRFWAPKSVDVERHLHGPRPSKNYLLSFNVPSEARALQSIGIDPKKYEWICLLAEWRLLNNLNPATPGPSCNSMEEVRRFLLGEPIKEGEKERGRKLVMDVDTENPFLEWNKRRREIEKYCAGDVEHLALMLAGIVMKRDIDTMEKFDAYLDQARDRGRYQMMLGLAESTGIPIDYEGLMDVQMRRNALLRAEQDKAMAKCPRLFKVRRKADEGNPHAILAMDANEVTKAVTRAAAQDPRWPRNPPTDLMLRKGTAEGSYKRDAKTVARALDDDRIKMPMEDRLLLTAYVEYGKEVEWLKFFKTERGRETWVDRTGSDFRLRPSMGAFGSVSMRAAPKAKHFPPACHRRIRSFVRIPKGLHLIQLDYGRQEFAVAAQLSDDEAMMEDYKSGDPYVGLAKRCGVWDGNKETRNVFKTVCLGLSYGQGAKGLRAHVSKELGMDVTDAQAVEWHRMFWDSYAVYSKWRETLGNLYKEGSPLVLPDGTALWGGKAGRLTVLNWPVQATGGAILRAAVAALSRLPDRVPELAFTLHDALYVWSPRLRVDEDAGLVGKAMTEGWRKVLSGDPAVPPKVGDPEIDVTVYGEAEPLLAEYCERNGHTLKTGF